MACSVHLYDVWSVDIGSTDCVEIDLNGCLIIYFNILVNRIHRPLETRLPFLQYHAVIKRQFGSKLIVICNAFDGESIIRKYSFHALQ